MKAKKPFSHYLGQTTYETIFLSTATPADIESLISCLKPNKAIGSKGFIKSTDHLPTDHRLTDHRPLTHQPTSHRPPTHQPTDPKITDPTKMLRLKDSKI